MLHDPGYTPSGGNLSCLDWCLISTKLSSLIHLSNEAFQDGMGPNAQLKRMLSLDFQDCPQCVACCDRTVCLTTRVFHLRLQTIYGTHLTQ